MILRRFLANHVLANLTFLLVLVIGTLSYFSLPRQQDPDINFNWVVVVTLLPGASAEDVEKLITDPLEDAIRSISDIRFVSSNSREGVSNLLIRFNQIDQRAYDKRISDVRREIQNTESEFPDAATTPKILEIISSNAYPAATVLVKGVAYDENLRLQAKHVIDELERMNSVDRVDNYGLNDPELLVEYDPERLQQYAINPTDLADSLRLLFNDESAGSVTADGRKWLVRMVGKQSDPAQLADYPVLGRSGFIRLGQVAAVSKTQQDPLRMVSSDGRPTILVAVFRKSGENTLQLIEQVQEYIVRRNTLTASTGVELTLVDDQSEITRNALNIMQTNALFGLSFVLLITFTFLGLRIASITTIGIPFILAGTFWILLLLGQTLNVMVLLAVVIALGMLVDDAVVVAEAIYHRIQRGEPRDQAVFSALREVAAPVTTAVLTTMAAFLPLVLLPGILGEFMRVIPMVVTIALAISLVEAYWMLPAHVMTMQFKPQGQSSGRFQQLRERMTRRIRIGYTRLLIKVLRFPYRMLLFSLLLFALAIGAMFSPMVKYDFFASDTLRLFYINVEMQPTSVLRDTHAKVAEVEALARRMLETDEYREMVGYAGLMFTETEPRLGNQYGQVLIGLNPRLEGMRTVEQIFDDLRASIDAVPGVANISFLKLSGGPPAAKPISVKVRGDNYAEILSAASALKQAMADNPLISDISDDADRGALQVSFRLRHDRVRELGLDPIMLARTIRIAADGEIVSAHQIRGEKTELRVRSARQRMDSIEQLGAQVVFNATGQALPLSELIEARHATALGNIRHYNFKRTITVEADIDKTQIDAVAANNFVREQWEKVKADYPNISLDFSGILDDIYQALDSMLLLGIFGVGLMYMILGTQFKSYFQPMMILVAVPLAFIGVVLGILITRQPVSLYTLYGIVALAGIAVNSAIVLISSANMRLEGGMSLLHSTVYAARRRVIPIIITSLTTIGGLFSLATGLGGESLIWGPVANAIVWGLGFSATLTLFVIPVLYRAFMARSHLSQARSAVVSANPAESG